MKLPKNEKLSYNEIVEFMHRLNKTRVESERINERFFTHFYKNEIEQYVYCETMNSFQYYAYYDLNEEINISSDDRIAVKSY